MTLTIACISHHAVVQATDRLASTEGKATNPLVNKNVIFCARDALVAISYTGLIRLYWLRTDDWTARKLRGEDEWVPGDRHAGPGMRFSKGPQWLALDSAVELLRGELEAVFSAEPQESVQELHAFAFLGWQWDAASGHCRPVGWVTEKLHGALSVTSVALLPEGLSESSFKLLALPRWPDEFPDTAREALFDALRPNLADPLRCEEILAESVRAVARRQSEVIGDDLLTVSMPAPQGRATAHVCFRPHMRTLHETAPMAYMPWFVLGDDFVMPASAIHGTYGPLIFEGGCATVTAEGTRPATEGAAPD